MLRLVFVDESAGWARFEHSDISPVNYFEASTKAVWLGFYTPMYEPPYDIGQSMREFIDTIRGVDGTVYFPDDRICAECAWRKEETE